MEALPRRIHTKQRPEPPSECSSPARSQGENPGPGQVSTFLKGEFPQGHKAGGGGWASRGGLRADTGLCPLQRGNPTSSADKNEFSRSDYVSRKLAGSALVSSGSRSQLLWVKTGEAAPQDVAGTVMLLSALCPSGAGGGSPLVAEELAPGRPCGPQPV